MSSLSKRSLLPSALPDQPSERPSKLRLQLPTEMIPADPQAEFLQSSTAPLEYAAQSQRTQSVSLQTSTRGPIGVPLQPFFTLLSSFPTPSSNRNTGNASHSTPAATDYYHPTVHYIFSDDPDADLVTEAALRTLADQQSEEELVSQAIEESGRVLDRRKPISRETTITGSEDDEEDVPPISRTGSLPARSPGIKERYIVLDMLPRPTPESASSTTVGPLNTASTTTATPITPDRSVQPPFVITSAYSLDPDFQILSTSLSPAPTFDREGDTSTLDPPNGDGGGWMLKIEGTSIDGSVQTITRGIGSKIGAGGAEITKASMRPPAVTSEGVDELVERFEREMGVLRRIVGGKLPEVDLGVEELGHDGGDGIYEDAETDRRKEPDHPVSGRYLEEVRGDDGQGDRNDAQVDTEVEDDLYG